MKKHIVDEKTGISYTLHGEYYLPDIELLPEEEEIMIGPWAHRHEQYLKETHPAKLSVMKAHGTLRKYLSDVEAEATDLLSRLVKQMAKAEGVTEQLKAQDQMRWVQEMENIQNRAREIVLNEVIYQ